MIAGLDFGTSNCSIGAWDASGPVLVPISPEGPYMPSVVYVKRREYSATPIDERRLQVRVAEALRDESTRRTAAKKRGEAYHGLSEEEIQTRERRIMTHEAVAAAERDYSSQTLADAIHDTSQLMFGEDAIRENILAPGEGFYFKSPKLFLASDVQPRYIEVFTNVITAMIAEVRERAEAKSKQKLTTVAIGHPVMYSSVTGAAGNRRALDIMEKSAREAGFSDITFLPEPFAAALNYEMGIASEEVILVVDVGGGTTDCAVVRVGPGRAFGGARDKDVLSYAGDRIGGVDLDFHLAWQSLMPHFGKGTQTSDGLPVPHPLLINAISVNDFPAQERFRKSGAELRELVKRAKAPEKVARLVTLWEQALQFRLVRSAELAKVDLSAAERVDLSLDYVDPELIFPLTRDELMNAIDGDLNRIGALAREAVQRAGAKIDHIFLTGGTSRSPAVVQAIRDAIRLDVPVLRGDDFGSVTVGLTQYAKGFFGSRKR